MRCYDGEVPPSPDATPSFRRRRPFRRLAALLLLVLATRLVWGWWIGRRAFWAPRRVLVTGAGPVGLLAALLGRQRGLDVTLFDLATDGPKPRLARALGADYKTGKLEELLAALLPDIVLECTGASQVVLEVMQHNAHGAVTCLVGVSAMGRAIPVDVA